MKIGLIDVDGKNPNLALMKISKYYKDNGCLVEFVDHKKTYDKIYASTILTWSKPKVDKLIHIYGDKLDIGGTGYDIKKTLPDEIEKSKPDYDLYTPEILYPKMRGRGGEENRMKTAKVLCDAGLGFTSRGCVRNCGFCFVPKKEGCLKQCTEIKDIINPRSKNIILHDNNFTSDPNVFDKLNEIRERDLTVSINQGFDIRVMTDELAYALSTVKHLRSLCYAWDLMAFEKEVLEGIKILSKYIPYRRQTCYLLTGFNTTYEEDEYRVAKLMEISEYITPYIMLYNDRKDDRRLFHYKRYINGHVYKSKECPSFEHYEGWRKHKEKMESQISFLP